LTIYQPNEPYVIKSGKHEGRVLELMMFSEYWFLVLMLQRINRAFQGEPKGKKNQLHLHLEWLLQKGENRYPQMICPQCEKRPAKYFSVVYENGDDFSISPIYTCCKDLKCADELRAQALDKSPQFLPFCFSVIKNFQLKIGQKRVIDLFRKVFELPKLLTRKAAFEFFRD